MTTPQYRSYGADTQRGDRTDLTAIVTATPQVVFKVPDSPASAAARRRKKVKVLAEEDYVDRVEAIIERDYFPELEKLHAQADYIDAKERNDTVTMMRLQEKYSGCKPVATRLASPATFETPQDLPREADPRRPGGTTEPDETPDNKEEKEVSPPEEKKKKKQSLDDFLANHTSEDNMSFDDIQEEAAKKHRIKNAWMYKDEAIHLERKAISMCLPSIEQQAALPWGGPSSSDSGHDDKPMDIDQWTYQNINHVMHYPDSLELTEDQKTELAKKKKEIVLTNTRLEDLPWKTEKQMEAMRREAERLKEAQEGKVGIDGKELVRPETPSVNGFKLMNMAPTPQLGPGDSPLMTWGEVESTPFRLEGAETPLVTGHGAGSGYSMRPPSQRDRLAKELADKNSKAYRDKKSKAIKQAQKSLAGARLATGGRPGSSLAHMSPAAQRLASGKLGIRLGTDQMLQSSYTPVRSKSTRSTPTPTRISTTPRSSAEKRTPVVGGSRGITDNLLNIGKSKKQHNVLSTDNLLNIGSRSRAGDFFQKPPKD